MVFHYSSAQSARLIPLGFVLINVCKRNDSPVKRERNSGPVADQTAAVVVSLADDSKSFLSACAGLGSFFFAVPGWRGGLERLEQSLRAGGNFIDRCIERGFVRARWLVESGDLSHELERCIPDFIGCDRRVEVEQVLYISAHLAILMLRTDDRRCWFHPRLLKRARGIAKAVDCADCGSSGVVSDGMDCKLDRLPLLTPQ